MSTVKLLEELERRGIRLAVVGDDLVCKGRRSALSHDLVDRLRASKPELVQQLTAPVEPRSHLRLVHPKPELYEAQLVRSLAELVVADMDAEE